MKFSRILVFYLSAVAAPSVLAVPLRRGDHCYPGSTDVRCVGQKDDQGRTHNHHSNGGNALSVHERQLSQTLKSILEGLPIVGPILAPLLGSLLGAIGLSEMEVASASKSSLNAEQIATLANFEFALSNAAHKVLLSGRNFESGAQSKLKARGVFPLGELATGVPMIGPFLRPLVPLLEALGLDSVDAKPNSVFSLALLNEEQSVKLSLFQTILRQELVNVLPNAYNSTPPDAPSPSKASPENVQPSPSPSPDASEDDVSDSDTPSPNDASLAGEPASTPVSSSVPK
ncbi:hypothetical protein BDM02DRAFT_3106843 [Thelephora ganbajun]|uniref:Uncharacterized protein n=1 Tax=Thelephora ganbajun TaxID=370292 RepID=A0ACB6ZXV4_THEGA|nr:hypothetical protein BDM02DRAFT_3106843 [Thelephora ganbajun]